MPEPESPSGIATISSSHSVDETVRRLEELLRAKNITLFGIVDHSGEAEKAGLQMRPTKLMIFGNPKAGTPVMAAAPSTAIDLPLKILIAENAAGAVSVSWNTPSYLGARHRIPDALIQNIAAAEALARAAAS
jgi:uncharacterized protein (DUF302 family)